MIEVAIDPVIAVVIGVLISTGIGGFSWWLKNRKRKEESRHKTMDDLSKQVWRVQKALLVLVKLLDKQIAKSHPELDQDLSEIIDELLEDERNHKDY
jgi:hypothetical protein